MRLVVAVAVAFVFTGQTSAQEAPPIAEPAAPLLQPALPEPKLDLPDLTVEAAVPKLTSLETEACRRLILEDAKGPRPGVAETTAATVGAVAGQAAGATVGGPLGAAVGGMAVGKLGQGVAKVAGKVLGRSSEKSKAEPVKGMPDPLLVAECDARDPELRPMLTAKP